PGPPGDTTSIGSGALVGPRAGRIINLSGILRPLPRSRSSYTQYVPQRAVASIAGRLHGCNATGACAARSIARGSSMRPYSRPPGRCARTSTVRTGSGRAIWRRSRRLTYRVPAMAPPPADLVTSSTRVASPQGVGAAAVAITAGVITSVTEPGNAPDAGRRVDVGAAALLPGVVDTHVHVNEPG